MPQLEINSIDDRKNSKPKWVIFALIIISIIIVLFGYGLYRLHNWNENRKALQEKDKIAKQQQAPQISVTLIEGWTIDDIINSLEKKSLLEKSTAAAELKKMGDGNAFIKSSMGTSLSSYEGFLFPDTYKFFETDLPASVFQKLLATFEAKFRDASKDVPIKMDGQTIRYQIPGFDNLTLSSSKSKTSGLNLQEVVTLASIVERESGRYGESASSQRLQEERQIVAGIFLNRLQIGQALESDATVNYVTKAGRASPTYKDLEADSPYNTYKNPWLPPGPIGNPSYSSLYAVLHPKKTDYFYFLHKQPSGEVVYSKTFDEHIANKNKYLK